MRRKPGQPSAVLPAAPSFVVLETASQLWAQAGDPIAAELGLRLVVALRATSLGWEGCVFFCATPGVCGGAGAPCDRSASAASLAGLCGVRGPPPA